MHFYKMILYDRLWTNIVDIMRDEYPKPVGQAKMMWDDEKDMGKNLMV